MRLDHVRAGGRIFIPAAALNQFFRDVAAADAEHFADEPTPPPQQPARSERQRERSIERAEGVLRDGGIL